MIGIVACSVWVANLMFEEFRYSTNFVLSKAYVDNLLLASCPSVRWKGSLSVCFSCILYVSKLDPAFHISLFTSKDVDSVGCVLMSACPFQCFLLFLEEGPTSLYFGGFCFNFVFCKHASNLRKLTGTELSFSMHPTFPGQVTKQDSSKWSLLM